MRIEADHLIRIFWLQFFGKFLGYMCPPDGDPYWITSPDGTEWTEHRPSTGGK